MIIILFKFTMWIAAILLGLQVLTMIVASSKWFQKMYREQLHVVWVRRPVIPPQEGPVVTFEVLDPLGKVVFYEGRSMNPLDWRNAETKKKIPLSLVSIYADKVWEELNISKFGNGDSEIDTQSSQDLH